MNTFILQTSFPDKKLRKALKPHFTIAAEKTEEERATLLDTFDEELKESGKILLQIPKALILLDTRTGIPYKQEGKAKFLCVPAIKNGTVKNELQSISDLRALLPGASLSSIMTTRKMLDDEGKTVARLHCFQLKKKKKEAQVILCQPLRGYDEEYSNLLSVLETIITIPTTLHEALNIKSNKYCAKPDISLDPTAPIIQTTNTIINTFIGVARQNENGIQTDYDTEFLHDYRVSLRKVRSVISLFKGVYSQETTTKLKEDFASLMQVTGRLRDLDVYLLDKDHYFSLVPPSTHQGLNIMFDAFENERNQTHHFICKALSNKSYEKKINVLATGFKDSTWPHGPDADTHSLQFGCKVIMKRYNKVCTIARSIDAFTPDETVHELRIHCKKLRYLMEFFTPLFNRKWIKSLIKSLKILQDNLGRFNDYSVQQESLAIFLDATPIKGADRIKVAESIGALTAMLNLLQQKEKDQVMANFAHFDSNETRSLFDKLFSSKE